MIARQFETDWPSLEAGLAWRPDRAAALLVVHDDDDEVAHPEDGAAVSSVWPDTTLVRTRGLGHNRILQSESLIEATLKHLLGS